MIILVWIIRLILFFLALFAFIDYVVIGLFVWMFLDTQFDAHTVAIIVVVIFAFSSWYKLLSIEIKEKPIFKIILLPPILAIAAYQFVDLFNPTDLIWRWSLTIGIWAIYLGFRFADPAEKLKLLFDI